ncbi:hypothetical protein ACFL54_09605, partial [Planctomycetota bacterium]
MDILNRIWEQIHRLLGSLSASQRISLAILGASIFISLTMLLLMTGGSSYVNLYSSRLNPEDAANITRFLNENGYKHKYEDGFISVLRLEKDMIVLDLGGEGLTLTGEDPYDYLKHPDITSTDKVKQLRHLHAIEKNLANTIETYKIVQQAKVSITGEDNSQFFFGDEKPPTAAIVVKLGFGKILNKKQVLAIANLVSNSIKGLEAGRVSISDTNMNPYKVPDQDGMVGGDGEKLELTKRYEEYFEKKVYEGFVAFLGPLSAHVTANVSLDIQYIEDHIHDIIGDGTIVTDKEKRKESEKVTGGSPLAPGTPTQLRNLAANSPVKLREHDITDTLDKIKDWDKLDRFVKSNPDAVDKKTMSIVVPYRFAALKDGEQEINPAEAETNISTNLKKWKDLVMAAAGITEPADVVLHA